MAALETDDPISQLPHWARVAFAARCAKHVSLLLASSWSEAAASRKQAFDRAIRLAEVSATVGTPQNGLDEAVAEAGRAAATALRALYGFTSPEPLPSSGDAAATAAAALKAAEQAAAAARASPEQSTDLATRAYRHARDAAASSHHESAFLEAMTDDLARLGRMVRFEAWTDATPVPAGLFR